MKECIPNTALKSRRNLPWMNKLIQSMRRRNKFLAIFRYKRLYLAQLNLRDPGSFWKTVKFLNGNQHSIPTRSQGEAIATTGAEKKTTNMLNEFFCSCFNTALPPFIPMCNQPSSHTEESFLCIEDEVCHLLLTLDTTKSSSPDGISAAILKHTAGTIAPSLTKIFNLSIRLGQLPSQCTDP